MLAQSPSLPESRPWVTWMKLPPHHLEEVACELNLALYLEASADMNKVPASPPQGGGLRAQSCSFHVLRPWVTRAKLSLTTLGSWLTCSISLFTQAGALGDVNKVATSPPRGRGLRDKSRSLPRLRPQVTRIKLLPLWNFVLKGGQNWVFNPFIEGYKGLFAPIEKKI